MGVTLTNKVIKDTYDGLLKFEDNKSASIAPRTITDGFGNDLGVQIGTDSVILEKGYTEMSISEINSESDGSVIVSKEWVEQEIVGSSNSIAYDFYGDGTETSFSFYNIFGDDCVMVQAYNVDTGDYLAQGAGLSFTRSYDVAGTPQHTITADFSSPVVNGLHCRIMLVRVSGPFY